MNTAECLKLEPEIRIEDLCISFQDKHGGEPINALQNVSLDIMQGEFISLLAPRAAAKPHCCAPLLICSSRARAASA